MEFLNFSTLTIGLQLQYYNCESFEWNNPGASTEVWTTCFKNRRENNQFLCILHAFNISKWLFEIYCMINVSTYTNIQLLTFYSLQVPLFRISCCAQGILKVLSIRNNKTRSFRCVEVYSQLC